jgi:hypothetical protein
MHVHWHLLCSGKFGVSVNDLSKQTTPVDAVLTMAAMSWSELVSSDSQLIIATGTSCTSNTSQVP